MADKLTPLNSSLETSIQNEKPSILSSLSQTAENIGNIAGDAFHNFEKSVFSTNPSNQLETNAPVAAVIETSVESEPRLAPVIETSVESEPRLVPVIEKRVESEPRLVPVIEKRVESEPRLAASAPVIETSVESEPRLAASAPVIETSVESEPRPVVDPTSLNPISKPEIKDDSASIPQPSTTLMNVRELTEMGIQQFNQNSELLQRCIIAIENKLSKKKMSYKRLTSYENFIDFDTDQSDLSSFPIVLYSNFNLNHLSEFVSCCTLYLFVLQLNDIVDVVHDALLEEIVVSSHYSLSLSTTSNACCLKLSIGNFSVDVFKAQVLDSVTISLLPAALFAIESEPFPYNGKQIGPYNFLDLTMQLLKHAEENKKDPYNQVNVLIARGVNETCIKYFETNVPNEIITQLCDKLIKPLDSMLHSSIIKTVLIAIIQNPSIMTIDGRHFFDVFPSGQYGEYFNEVAVSSKKKGPLFINSVPLTRLDIFISVLTGINEALHNKNIGNIIVSGGAALSHHIQDFMNDCEMNMFSDEIQATCEVDMELLKQKCKSIPMNDIDCFVFGDLSREFLSVLSLYMILMYDNFFHRPQLYNKTEILKSFKKISFQLSVPSSDSMTLFMYGNMKNDANTRLISKFLQKNKSVELVSHEVQCFSQLSHPLLNEELPDSYHMRPIDLVKKNIGEFYELYLKSLYPNNEPSPPSNLREMVEIQFMHENMISLKTAMLDVICIFCDEGKSLFTRIFLARKNPKDFIRLQVFIEIYCLQVLRILKEIPSELLVTVKFLRKIMDGLYQNYYMEQGNLAAIGISAVDLQKDRTIFLNGLREFGRMVVNLPDPFANLSPLKFRKTVGMKLIDFFKKSQTMKYNINVSSNMKKLISTYMSPQRPYNSWLTHIFSKIKFSSEVESFYYSMLDQITKIGDSSQTLDFKDMEIFPNNVLTIYHELIQITPDKKLMKFKDLFESLFTPLKNHIHFNGIPTPYYVGVSGLYEDAFKEQIFPVFLSILFNDNVEIKEKIETLPYDQYTDLINEEIGRVILNYYEYITSSKKSKGGYKNTIKRLPLKKWNKTRNFSRKINRRTKKINKIKTMRFTKKRH